MHFDKVKTKGKLILLLTALVWGFAFVFQNQAIEHIGTFTLNGTRCIIAAIFLFVFIFIKSKKHINFICF